MKPGARRRKRTEEPEPQRRSALLACQARVLAILLLRAPTWWWTSPLAGCHVWTARSAYPGPCSSTLRSTETESPLGKMNSSSSSSSARITPSSQRMDTRRHGRFRCIMVLDGWSTRGFKLAYLGLDWIGLKQNSLQYFRPRGALFGVLRVSGSKFRTVSNISDDKCK